MRKPVIAIAANVFDDPHYEFAGYRRIVLNADYPRSVTAAGGVPLLLPPGDNLSVVAEQLAVADGLLLSGGLDIDPARYGQQPRRSCGPTNPLRDAYEFELLRVAEERDLPTFGICRGLQLINVFYGGTLRQDVAESGSDEQHDQVANPASPSHDVTLSGFCAEALGTDAARVNSFHHQVIHELAPGFSVAATSRDGMIEAIERPGERLLAAVQWHPEMMSAADPNAQALFRWFVEQAVQ